jgi:hypothetical protein
MMLSSWTIRQRVLLLVAALAVPMNVLVAAALVLLAERERDSQLKSLEYTARAVSSAVDAQLTSHIVVGRSLAASPALLKEGLAKSRCRR